MSIDITAFLENIPATLIIVGVAFIALAIVGVFPKFKEIFTITGYPRMGLALFGIVLLIIGFSFYTGVIGGVQQTKQTLPVDTLVSQETPSSEKTSYDHTDVYNTSTESSSLKSIPENPVSESTSSATDSIDMEFMLIPAGTFNMGSPESDADSFSYEYPVHEVNIETDFYIGKYEVTQEQWRKVMGSNPSYSKGDDKPVQNVSWYSVQEFIKKLNEMEGTDKYRLPSEAEWEYACRAGTTTKYSFGDDYLQLGEYAWYSSNAEGLHPVGQKKPNPWGLYDMYGNVGEWVQDTFDLYDMGAMTLNDGSAWDNGISSSSRAQRGGCYYLSTRDCRSASRLYGSPDVKYDYCVGFRLVRDV